MKLKKMLTGAALVVLAGAAVYACKPGGHFKKLCAEDYPDRILSHIDGKVKELNLTGAQLDKYNEIRAEVRADLLKGRDEKLRVFDEVKDRLAKSDPDLESIARDLKKHHDENRKIHEERMNRYFESTAELYRMLNKEQKAKIVEKLRDAVKRFDCR